MHISQCHNRLHWQISLFYVFILKPKSTSGKGAQWRKKKPNDLLLMDWKNTVPKNVIEFLTVMNGEE